MNDLQTDCLNLLVALADLGRSHNSFDKSTKIRTVFKLIPEVRKHRTTGSIVPFDGLRLSDFQGSVLLACRMLAEVIQYGELRNVSHDIAVFSMLGRLENILNQYDREWGLL